MARPVRVEDLPESLRVGEWKAMKDDPVRPEHLLAMLKDLRSGPKKIMGSRHNDVRKRLLKREGLVVFLGGGKWSLTSKGQALFE